MSTLPLTYIQNSTISNFPHRHCSEPTHGFLASELVHSLLMASLRPLGPHTPTPVHSQNSSQVGPAKLCQIMSLFCVKLHIPQSPDSAAHHRVGPASPPAPQPLTSSPLCPPHRTLWLTGLLAPPQTCRTHSLGPPPSRQFLLPGTISFFCLRDWESSFFFYLLLRLHYPLREALPIYPLFYFF